MTEAGECYNEALSAVKGMIILNSSAGPGWYADVRHDIGRNVEKSEFDVRCFHILTVR